MILVKTSLWIAHLRETDETPGNLLETGQVLTQAFVIGELALGSLANRERFLRLMDSRQTPVTPAIKKSAHSS